ncbi:MAG: glycosyltransferase family 2 protein [Candidatus Bathyarchaeia archaeon]
MLDLSAVDKPLVSVIVLNWNGKRFLYNCLSSLLNQNFDSYEVLFVDNNSSDDGVAFVKNHFGKNSRLRIIVLPENFGFSKGNNIGLTYARGDYVIFLNNDTKVNCNFVAELVSEAKKDPKIGCVGCKILSLTGKTWFSQRFTNGGFLVPFFLQTLVEQRIESLSNCCRTNLANSGCAVLYKRCVLEKIGCFEEDYVSNFEDWDLGYRLNLAGFRSVYIPLPLVVHVGAGSEGTTPERRVKCYRNMLLTYFKNYELKNLVIRFPIVSFVLLPLWHSSWFLQRSILGLPDFDRKRVGDYFLSLFRAYYQFLWYLKKFAIKRYSVQGLRKVADRNIFDKTKNTSLV